MTPWVQCLISETDIQKFNEVKNAVSALPDLDLGIYQKSGEKIILSCHILARAVGRVFELKCVDGKFYPYFSHSWNETKEGNIFDVYPVAVIGGPTLMSGDKCSPANFLYIPEVHIEFVEEAGHAVDIVATELQKHKV